MCLDINYYDKDNPIKFCFIPDALLLAKSITAYTVGHFHISRKTLGEHFTFAKDEARDGFSQVESDGKSTHRRLRLDRQTLQSSSRL